ncbi:urotensin-2 receptor-like [Hemiscyllium ocellatum]|uniref:urotensin-2 receptor-like n=1 Tax=Hemiscyllium ocellatum TaxID=170820 RepID=UPI002967681E|nr:urotensin-2 receptor-like [Hemiscyllium ocellatum]
MERVENGHLTKGNLSSNSSLPGPGNVNEVLITTLLGVILTMMCVCGTLGNIYTLAIANRLIKSAGSMYVYIANLALADLLYLLTIPFVVCTYFARDWYFGEIGCRFLLSLDLLTMHASIFILTAMSVERYRAVTSPLASQATKVCRRMITAAIWSLSCILTLPMMIMIHLQETISPSASTKRICFPTWSPDAYKTYLTVLFNTSILSPGIVIGYLYIRLAQTYWLSGRMVLDTRNRTLKQKVLYMIFSIILLYWTCFLPFWVWQLVKLYTHETLSLTPLVQMYINFCVTCLTYSNSCINPFLYVLLTKNYKEYMAHRSRTSTERATFKRGAKEQSRVQKVNCPKGHNQSCSSQSGRREITQQGPCWPQQAILKK